VRSETRQAIKTLASRGVTKVMEAGVFFFGLVSPVFAQGIQDGADAARPDDAPGDLFGQQGLFKTITNVLIFLIGAIAVVMLIIGGFRYVVSGGNDQSVTDAKNTIMYAIIGLAVAILSYAMINFVIDRLTN
jgi:cytochrome bd-type quinol oxidase subunit 2